MKKKATLKKPRASQTQHSANLQIFKSRSFQRSENQDQTQTSRSNMNRQIEMDDEEEKKSL